MTEILILDYNRPEELKTLVYSLGRYCSFEYEIVILNNGGDPTTANKLKKEGLVTKVIHNGVNVGCGLGTIQLFSQCRTKYAFYIQVDHELICPIVKSDVDNFIASLENNEFDYIDLAGNQGQGKYSERAQFIGRDYYLSIPKDAGGPGPLDDLKWTEECVQDANPRFVSINTNINGHTFPPFLDKGESSVRSNPDGSQWKHHPDTKVVYCLKPPSEKFSFPPLSDEEWELALAGNWPKEGKIIEEWGDNSFEVWNKLP